MAVLEPVCIHDEFHRVGVPFEIQAHRHCWQEERHFHFSGVSMEEGLNPVNAILLRLGFPVLPAVDGCERNAEGGSKSLLRHSQLGAYCFDLLRLHQKTLDLYISDVIIAVNGERSDSFSTGQFLARTPSGRSSGAWAVRIYSPSVRHCRIET